jgi:hypothetical protein
VVEDAVELVEVEDEDDDVDVVDEGALNPRAEAIAARSFLSVCRSAVVTFVFCAIATI